MGLKSKGFEAGRISVLENMINKFLTTLDEKNFVDIKLVVTKSEHSSPPESYAAILIYRE